MIWITLLGILFTPRRYLLDNPLVKKTETVTQLLHAWRDGEDAALDRLMPRVYSELRRQAKGHLRRERDAHTLQPTALVNEAYLRLVDQSGVDWQSRDQFYAIAAQAMRRVLVDHARKRLAEKRGGDRVFVQLDSELEVADVLSEKSQDVIALDDALHTLTEIAPRQAEVVALRFFAGLTIAQVAGILGLSPATIKTDWQIARAWLFRELNPGDSD